MTQPLAIERQAFTEAKGWRRGQHLVDALPYIDSLTAEEKREVDKLIEEEMRSSTKSPADYLKELPPLPALKFEGHPLLKEEYERVRQGQPMPAVDVSRLRLDPPPLNRRGDVAAWRSALDNAHSQLEHQYNRLLNLELLLKFGPNSWRAHNERLEAHNKRLEAELQETKREIEATNKSRKLEQSSAQQELSSLEEEWMGLALKNARIQAACVALEEEAAELEEQQAKQAQQPQGEGQQGEGQGEMQQ